MHGSPDARRVCTTPTLGTPLAPDGQGIRVFAGNPSAFTASLLPITANVAERRPRGLQPGSV